MHTTLNNFLCYLSLNKIIHGISTSNTRKKLKELKKKKFKKKLKKNPKSSNMKCSLKFFPFKALKVSVSLRICSLGKYLVFAENYSTNGCTIYITNLFVMEMNVVGLFCI